MLVRCERGFYVYDFFDLKSVKYVFDQKFVMYTASDAIFEPLFGGSKCSCPMNNPKRMHYKDYVQ